MIMEIYQLSFILPYTHIIEITSYCFLLFQSFPSSVHPESSHQMNTSKLMFCSYDLPIQKTSLCSFQDECQHFLKSLIMYPQHIWLTLLFKNPLYNSISEFLLLLVSATLTKITTKFITLHLAFLLPTSFPPKRRRTQLYLLRGLL